MTGNPYAQARADAAAALAGVGVTVHAYDPGAISPPCIVLRPGQPWKTARGHVTLDVDCYANGVDNTAALQRLEQLLWDCEQAAAAAKFSWSEATSPQAESTTQTARATFSITLRPC